MPLARAYETGTGPGEQAFGGGGEATSSLTDLSSIPGWPSLPIPPNAPTASARTSGSKTTRVKKPPKIKYTHRSTHNPKYLTPGVEDQLF